MSFPFQHPTTGGICCSNRKHACDKCKVRLANEARTPGADNSMTYEAPDCYEPHLAALRLAASTPESRFAERYAAERLRALDIEYEIEKTRAAAARPSPRLTTAEVAQYMPPDTYQLALDARKERR